MDFELPGEDHPQRKPIRAWFEAHPHPTGRDLAQAGFAVPHWPKPWGLAADAELQLIIDQEMKRAGVHVPRNPVAINNCAQSLLTHGTEAQRQRYLLPALAGEEIWCMLFSEPSGGSDLGALRTVARRDGDHYVVKGHKIWTSLAHKAKVGMLVARTNPDVPKHQGLSQFLLDMDTPGITRAADHRHVGARERIQRGLPRRGAHPGRPPARQGGRRLGAQHDPAADRAGGAVAARRDLGPRPVGARAGRGPGRDRRARRRRDARGGGAGLCRGRDPAPARLSRAERPHERPAARAGGRDPQDAGGAARPEASSSSPSAPRVRAA